MEEDRGMSFCFKGPLLLLCVACFCVFASPAKPRHFTRPAKSWARQRSSRQTRAIFKGDIIIPPGACIKGIAMPPPPSALEMEDMQWD
ncbi:unnamed protein product [Boreogadus saida]